MVKAIKISGLLVNQIPGVVIFFWEIHHLHVQFSQSPRYILDLNFITKQ